jgi:hypothetical protein
VEAYNPRAEKSSNDVTVARTEPCIALYPSANKNGSWLLYNLETKTFVRCTQWKKLPRSQLVINIMNEIAGERYVTLADLDTGVQSPQEFEEASVVNTHTPVVDPLGVPTVEEQRLCYDMLDDLPDLEAQDMDDDSDSESRDVESVTSDDLDEEMREFEEILQGGDSDTSSVVQQEPTIAVRRSARINAGVKNQDEAYEWNLMDMTLGAAI